MLYKEYLRRSYALSREWEAIEYLLDRAIGWNMGTLEDVEAMAHRLAEIAIEQKRLHQEEITPSGKVIQVTHVRVVGDFQLDLTFNDGVQKRVDLTGQLKGGVFERLKTPEAFATAIVGLGTVVWPGPAPEEDLDVAPEYLYTLPEPGTEQPYPWEPVWSDRLKTSSR